MLPVVDFGVAIGLVVGFLLDVVLRQGRCFVGRGDHISSCVGAGTWIGLLVLEEGSERKSTGADGDVMYTWPCELHSPHKHDRITFEVYVGVCGRMIGRGVHVVGEDRG